MKKSNTPSKKRSFTSKSLTLLIQERSQIYLLKIRKSKLLLLIFSIVFLYHQFDLVMYFYSCQVWVFSYVYETSSKTSYMFLYDESVGWSGQNEVVSMLHHYISNILHPEVHQLYVYIFHNYNAQNNSLVCIFVISGLGILFTDFQSQVIVSFLVIGGLDVLKRKKGNIFAIPICRQD